MVFVMFVSFGEANKINKWKTNRKWLLCGNYSNKPKQKQTVFNEGDIWQLQELVDLWSS